MHPVANGLLGHALEELANPETEMKDQHDLSGHPHRYVDWHLEGDQSTDALFEELIKSLHLWHQPLVASSARFLKVIDSCLKQLMLNLVRTQQLGLDTLCLPTNRTYYSVRSHFHGPTVSHNGMAVAREFLTEMGLVTAQAGQASGYVSFRATSTITLTAKGIALIDDRKLTNANIKTKQVHLIRMKTSADEDGTRKLVPFVESDSTKVMIENLKRINALYARTNIRLDLTDEQLAEMNLRMQHKAAREGKPAPMLLTHNLDGYLYRVFNDERFDHGGRLYGCEYQNVPKDYRPYVTINGSPTVEVDFSAMHPTMLYAELGIQLAFDPYLISKELRGLTKTTFNALLNARSSGIDPLPEFNEIDVGMSWIEWIKKVKEHMGPLRQFLGSGCGIKLQRKDSDIAEAVVMEFISQGIPILPIHDSFIVPVEHEARLIKVMRDKFRRATGFVCEVKSRKRATAGQSFFKPNGYLLAA